MVTATILNGSELAKAMRAEIEAEVEAFKARHGYPPTLAVVRAGEDPASQSYGSALEKAFGARGVGLRLYILPVNAAQEEIAALVRRLNADETVQGIMIQEPLPAGIDEATVKDILSPDKDVDGVHPVNAGRLAQAPPAGSAAPERPYFVPATPLGGMEILKRYGIELAGKHAMVLGRSPIVGKPMAQLLLRENATVTVCHSRTIDLPAVCRTADLLFAAVGRAEMVKGDWLKPGVVVIDFGVNFKDDRMCGDVAYAEAAQKASAVTPVPGGTGPMTNVMLMRNVIEAAKRQVG